MSVPSALAVLIDSLEAQKNDDDRGAVKALRRSALRRWRCHATVCSPPRSGRAPCMPGAIVYTPRRLDRNP